MLFPNKDELRRMEGRLIGIRDGNGIKHTVHYRVTPPNTKGLSHSCSVSRLSERRHKQFMIHRIHLEKCRMADTMPVTPAHYFGPTIHRKSTHQSSHSQTNLQTILNQSFEKVAESIQEFSRKNRKEDYETQVTPTTSDDFNKSIENENLQTPFPAYPIVQSDTSPVNVTKTNIEEATPKFQSDTINPIIPNHVAHKFKNSPRFSLKLTKFRKLSIDTKSIASSSPRSVASAAHTPSKHGMNTPLMSEIMTIDSQFEINFQTHEEKRIYQFLEENGIILANPKDKINPKIAEAKNKVNRIKSRRASKLLENRDQFLGVEKKAPARKVSVFATNKVSYTPEKNPDSIQEFVF